MRKDKAILLNPNILRKVTIIEGPDGVGKTYLTQQIKKSAEERGIDLRQVRCPDDRGGAKIRSVIMSEDLSKNPKALAFLFFADFIYAYEALMKSEMDNPNVRFIFDRFLPSTCIYQNIDIKFADSCFATIYPEMFDVFSKAQYLYLTPSDMEKHKLRLASKNGDEINHLDPVGDEAMRKNVMNYHIFSQRHSTHGLLGCADVSVIHV